MLSSFYRVSYQGFNFVISHWTQIVKFTVIGFLTFGINLLVFHIFYHYFELDYRLAITFAYIISLISHYLLHRYFTFRANGQNIKNSIFKYVVMLAINYVIIISVVWFITEVVSGSPYWGLVLSTAITASFSFFFMKYFVFVEY